MANLANNANESPAPTLFKRRPWYISEKSMTVHFPLSKEIMWARLSEAFRRGVVRMPVGLLEAKVSFGERIVGDDLEMHYSSRGKGSISYIVTGELEGWPEGSAIKLLIRDNVLYRLAMSLVMSFSAALAFAFFGGFAGDSLAAVALSLTVVFGIFFTAGTYLSEGLHRGTVLRSTAEMLTRVAEGNHYA